MSEGGWLSEDMVARANAMIEGLNAGLESSDETVGKAIRRMQKSIVEEYEKQERKENMNIEDCKNVNEFFGVELGGHIWVEGHKCSVWKDSIHIRDYESGYTPDGQALVGCLTGQLKWSTEPPKPEMTEDEKKILREIAAWFPQSKRLFTTYGDIYLGRGVSLSMPFGDRQRGKKSKAYEILVPILEKHGEIGLDDYRGDEDEESPFGSCDFCGYEFSSELINEYEITHCPKCGEEIEESIDLGW